jgi:hypothetical protein
MTSGMERWAFGLDVRLAASVAKFQIMATMTFNSSDDDLQMLRARRPRMAGPRTRVPRVSVWLIRLF